MGVAYVTTDWNNLSLFLASLFFYFLLFISFIRSYTESVKAQKLSSLKNAMPTDQILYSDKYNDDLFEYRHVILPADLAKLVPRTHLMSETEWRNLGVQQSPGWIHYMVHNPGIVDEYLIILRVTCFNIFTLVGRMLLIYFISIILSRTTCFTLQAAVPGTSLTD